MGRFRIQDWLLRYNEQDIRLQKTILDFYNQLYKIYDTIILGGGVVSNDKFHNISRNFKLEDVEMIKTIGTGTFARVYLCRPKAHLNR